MFELTTADYVKALAGPFVAGFAVQQGTEVVSSVISLFCSKNKNCAWDDNSKIRKGVLSLTSVVLSWIVVYGAGLDVLKPFIGGNTDFIHIFTTVIFVSAGTEGFNSLLKWLSYKKDDAKAAAAVTKQKAAANINTLAS